MRNQSSLQLVPKLWILVLLIQFTLVYDKLSAQSHESLLYEHFKTQATAKLNERSKARLATLTKDQVLQKSQDVRKWLTDALGPWPEKTPLNAIVRGTVEGAGIRVEKILFESRPGHHITANLYLPVTPPPWPGVIVPCGHSANGKAAETYQRASILLAKSGMAALCYDPIGQGERVQALKPDGKPVFNGSTTEHTRIANGSLLVGLQTAHYRVWDGIRALDYLESRPEIDKTRLGCTGNSGGGTLTSFLMAIDDRIAAAAASCYLTSYNRLLSTIGPQDAEQNITGMIASGLDHVDFILARLPKPTLMCVATRDFFDITGAWETFREAKKLYGAAGFGERVDLFEFDDTHGFSSPRRAAAVRWLRRWLLDKSDPISEPEFPIFTDQQLQVTAKGQVLHDSNEVSVFQLNQTRANQLADQRIAKKPLEFRASVKNRLHLPEPIKPASLRPNKLMDQKLQQVYYTAPDGFELAALKVQVNSGKIVNWNADSDARVRTIIVGFDAGSRIMNAAQAEEQLSKILNHDARDSDGVYVFLDVRGTGQSGSPKQTKSADPNGQDWRESSLALLLNQNLVGLRTADLLSVIGAESSGSEGIELVGIGRGAIWAIHATALNSKVSRLIEIHGPKSWSAEVSNPESQLQLSDIVEGVLADYDLDDLRTIRAVK